MAKGSNIKAPFVREPKKSRAHYRYALHHSDPRINFVLVRFIVIISQNH